MGNVWLYVATNVCWDSEFLKRWGKFQYAILATFKTLRREILVLIKTKSSWGGGDYRRSGKAQGRVLHLGPAAVMRILILETASHLDCPLGQQSEKEGLPIDSL